MPNFIEIGQTSLEIGGVNWASDKKNNLFCHGQKRDYLSRDWQCARGATKNVKTLIKRLLHLWNPAVPASDACVELGLARLY